MKRTKSMVAICLFFSAASYGQSSLSVSVPTIWSKVTVKDNWTPPTAPSYKEYLSSSAYGYGLNLNYSFRPTFLIKDKHFLLNVGVGYFQQRFNIRRPFDYNSFIYIIYYTDYYTYHCLNLSVGLTYNLPLGKKYFLNGNLSYYQQSSFQQDYTPTYSSPNRGFDGFTQTNNNQIDFGKMLNFSVGINRNLGDRFSIGLNMLIPVYVRWRNDKIFKDDPSSFYSPKFSLGSSISITYNFKKKQ